MKIAICSDIHLEFGTISLENTENAEVLILSGDICVAKEILDRDPYETRFDDKSSRIHLFFQECCARFKHVVYISGNHEHYHGDFAETFKIFRERLGYLANLHILDKESVLINDIMFIGGTLWTDMNKEDGITLMHMKGMMNDFRTVKNSNRMVSRKVMKYKKDENGQYVSEIKDGVNVMVEEGFKFEESISTFSPEDAVEDHKKMLGYLKVMLEGKHDQKFVVVGHHAPTKLSTHPRYADELIMNGGYSSDLSEFILDYPQIKLWTHGHTHEEFDYLIGTTRIVCNPRGYINYEDRADNFKLKFVEV
jgi:DNA repair exonuclease SbcCD nuclease subunit